MLSLEELASRDFKLTEKDGLVLVQPSPDKNLNRSNWKRDELPYRSVIIEKATGNVVSAGFPKFFNYGEGGPSHIENSHLRKSLQNGEFTLTEKIDGSLAIRYVYNGEVRWRTRGTLEETDMVRAIKQTASKYPCLSDPEFAYWESMLFEFVHPDFPIVVRYWTPDLILLGRIRHEDFHLHPYKEVKTCAQTNSLPVVPYVVFPQNGSIETLIEEIDNWKGREGVVARCGPGEKTLIKIKSAEYLLRHRLRFSLTVKTIRQICWDNHMECIEDFEEWLKDQKADWELIEAITPLIHKYFQIRNEAVRSYGRLYLEVDHRRKLHPDRGDFARNYATLLDQPLKAASFAILDDKTWTAFEIILNSYLDNDFKSTLDFDDPDMLDL